MGHAGSNKNGYTVWLRFKKACETCHKKYGDGARHAIENIARRQFGDDMTLGALREILAAGEFWKLDLQSQRAQHIAAVVKSTTLDEFDLLVGSQPQEWAATTPTDLNEAVPF